ncbi:glycerophosphodiester phosphodiesterase [Neorhizobium sp. P12A]|uniref:glycerophosphodiester phosphodiesterase n=1 Tax=Neorhizobium sp. P12A TaxID=2268027 RepID=UPI0011EBB0A9|nr:glycerophosphodiester phosphodiesterase family protein [Neorhizobium sp. P12A]KAA0691987.1 glycerophosphodiester phosphodiesterase [Neorhizobium sp. P12A]
MTFSFFAKQAGHIHVCGHRGHSLGAPENTIAAIRATRDLGGTTCEIDTVLARDNEIVVLHDLFVDRTSNGAGAAKDLTSAEIAALDAGSWFGEDFAGERIPTLREAIAAARELDLGLEVEVKEKRDLETFIAVLKDVVADPADLDRVMMISFDHVSLKAVKAAVPGIKTGGIIQERLGDPLAVARAADLDQMCIDLAVFDPREAERLHAAGISIRCHAYRPSTMERSVKAGLDWTNVLASSLRAGLIDTVSGDDVAWLRKFVDQTFA